MDRNIVICSDGTGNSAAKFHGTNVWRIFTALDRQSADAEQITYYDDGVGTDSVRILRLLGGGFGLGLTRNIIQAYRFLVMNYEPNDKVFLFGFSRGAFTVRSLAGLIGRCGLMDRRVLMAADSEDAQTTLLRRVVRAYRSTKTISDVSGETDECKERRIRNELCLSDLKPRSIPIEFIGVWDTVDAVGMPVDELKHVIEYFWGRTFGRRLWHFNDQIPHYRIRYAYQALALDDERRTFHPILWELPEDDDRHVEESTSRPNAVKSRTRTQVEQLWFAGMHANVGGGYPRDELAHVSLNWMIENAKRHGLIFLARQQEQFKQAADVHGHMHNSRTGLRMFYRPGLRDPYRRRKKLQLEASWPTVLAYAWNYFFGHREWQVNRKPMRPLVHESVYARARRASNGYAPKVLVASPTELYTRVDKDGLPPAAVERLRQLDSIHKKLHNVFVTLMVFVSTWALPLKVPSTSPIYRLGQGWKELKRHVVPGSTEAKFEEFSAIVVEGVEKFVPGVVASVLGSVTSDPVAALLLLTALAVVWKANRRVDVETRLYAFKSWHWIGDERDVDQRLKQIEKIVNSKTFYVGRGLFVLVALMLVVTITMEILRLIPIEAALVLVLLVVVGRRIRLFER